MEKLVPQTDEFRAVTILLPVMNETHSLTQTIAIIDGECGDRIEEYLILVSPNTLPESLATINLLQSRYGERVRVHVQSLPYLGGALREGFHEARGSHVVMMASDLETDPHDVAVMIERSQRSPGAVITASRWMQGGSFAGYSPVKLVLNKLFQVSFSLLYQSPLSDMTYGFRLFPTGLVQAIAWKELRHPFLLETIVKPLRLGVPVIEIPSKWRARSEGESSNTFIRNFAYFRVGLAAKFQSPDILTSRTS